MHMKIKFGVFLVLLVLSGYGQDQEIWSWLNPLPQGNTLTDVQVFADNSALVVGNTGTVLTIDPDGKINTVRHHLNGIDADLNSVFFVNSDTGWIAGTAVVLATVDGGLNWKEISVVDSAEQEWNFNKIFFINDSVGWVSANSWGWGWSAGVIYHTQNGGEDWEEIPGGVCHDFHFLNAKKGWAVFENSLFFTTDGGLNWTEIANVSFSSIYFINDSIGWGAGDSGLRKTDDGGFTWYTIIDSLDCYDVVFHDSQHGYVLTQGDYIISSSDGGDTWHSMKLNSPESFEPDAFAFNSGGYGIAVGVGGQVYCKISDANKWTSLTKSASNADFSAIHVINKDTIWICGSEYSDQPAINSVLLHSVDGGINWEKSTYANEKYYSSRLNDIFFSNKKVGWAVGENNIVLNTSDGGNTWELIETGVLHSDIGFKKVVFTDSLHGFIVGVGTDYQNQLIFIHTQDGGNTWQDYRNNLPEWYIGNDLCFTDNNHGWLVGSLDVYKTDNGGRSWELVNRKWQEGWEWGPAQFLDSLTCWVAGSGGYENNILVYTEDGGNNWHTRFSNSAPIHILHFSDKSNGYIFAVEDIYSIYYQNEQVHYTHDGGQSWHEFQFNPIPGYGVNSVAFADRNTGWMVGTNGMILKTNTGGLTEVIEKSSSKFDYKDNYHLYQNYPNPFNPSTTIEFSLPKSEFTVLKIYNILGKEIAVLVSKHLDQGNHTYTFNGKNLASGVYMYRILTESGFSETKKFVLLK